MNQKEKPFDWGEAKRRMRQLKVDSVLEGLGYDPRKTRLEDLRGTDAVLAEIRLTSRTSEEERARTSNYARTYFDHMF